MAQDFLSQFIARAQSRDSRLGRALKSRTAGVLERCADGFQRDNVLLWASALTYTTGLSIVPILAVGLSALNGLGGAQVIRPLLERYLTANSPEITDRLMSFVSNVNARTLGAVGARQILLKHLPSLSSAGLIISSVAIWAGFFFLYVFFPNRRVRLEAAAVGALVASILLQIAQWAFIYFQYGVNSYAAIYGALASIPVLLTWIYMTWLIILLGAEVTAAFERRNQPMIADPWAMSERAVALAVAVRLGERMAGRRGTVTPVTLSSELGIDEAVLVEVLRRLERCGIVIETASGDEGERGLFLARDSSTIGLGEVLESVRGGGPGMMPSDARVAAMLERLHQGERETLGGFTVRDLIERTASAATAAPSSGAAPERAAG